MLRLLNVILVVCVLAAGFALYTLEHRTRSVEREIARVDKGIESEYEFIGLLNAEWSMLTRPQRLEQLARNHLELAPVLPDQLVELNGLAAKLPAAPAHEPDKTPASDDPMADLLRMMQ
ncbi:cell division protein FtsL [Anderseniella sp. Alg231-50]|uniref:cell division protein FtsL n=1 Tax=Anderseniella sp. Alg231-50 TaxID=1922226 RepID=UPI00307BB8A7